MPPRTSPFALLGIGAAALGVSTVAVLPALLLSRYLALVGLVCGALAIVLGLLALLQIARFPKRIEGRPMAIAAVIFGALEALGYLALLLLHGSFPVIGLL
jgi:hypothetical protein